MSSLRRNLLTLPVENVFRFSQCRISKNTHTRYLLAALLHHEEQVGPVGHGEGEAVFERVGAVMVVADAVLVDVVHGEAAGLPVVLAVAGALDGAVTRGLDHGENDGFRLHAVVIWGEGRG